jgi:hypothetical protein
MTESDERLAGQIAEISPLEYEDALAALKEGGKLRELALSILESEAAYEKDIRQINGARAKLRQAIPA